jgi:hypothetical protein
MLELLGLSLKYLLDELAELVLTFLDRQLSIENIFMIAVEVDRISATECREKTVQYFLKHWSRLARSDRLLLQSVSHNLSQIFAVGAASSFLPHGAHPALCRQ